MATRRKSGWSAVQKQVAAKTNTKNKRDREYETLKTLILEKNVSLKRTRQAIVRNWVKKLDEPTTVLVWKRLRNTYAQALLGQMDLPNFREPFNKNPPAQLGNFSTHGKGVSRKKVAKKASNSEEKGLLKTPTSTPKRMGNGSAASPYARNAPQGKRDGEGYATSPSEKSPSRRAEKSNGKQTPGSRVKITSLGLLTPADKKYMHDAQALKEEKVQLEEMHEVSISKLKAKILQLETLISAQKARIEFLERESKDIKSHGKIELERNQSFFEARLKRMKSEHEQEKMRLAPAVQLHPAEIELAKKGSIGVSKVIRRAKKAGSTQANVKMQMRAFAASSAAKRNGSKQHQANAVPVTGGGSAIPTPEFFKYLDDFTKATKNITEKFRRDNPLGDNGIISPVKSLSYQRYDA
jgi:hypothetical protein